MDNGRTIKTNKGLRVREVAEKLGTATDFVRDEINRGHLPVLRLSARAIRVLEKDLDAYIAARREILR